MVAGLFVRRKTRHRMKHRLRGRLILRENLARDGDRKEKRGVLAQFELHSNVRDPVAGYYKGWSTSSSCDSDAW